MTVVITKIEPQKNHKDRYSVFAAGQFLVGISQETLLKFDLYSGKKISAENLSKLKNAESEIKLRDQAYRYLSRRAHSCQELQLKLSNKGYSKELIQHIISDFLQSGYLNDHDFARSFIIEEINLKKSGPLLIKNKLLKKGISLNICDDLISFLYDFQDQLDNCAFLAGKKYKQGAEDDDQKKKKVLINYLRRKGYNWEHIMKILEGLFNTDDIGQGD